MPARDAPHLLYVAWGFPPSRGAGMYRALATANAFAADGWRVTVLTAQRETFERLTGVDASMEARIDPRIRVVRVPFDLTRDEVDLRRWSRLRADAPLAWAGVQLLRERAVFPESRYGGWAGALARAALAVHAEDPVSLTIGTANPNVDFLPGWTLHRRHGVPYVCDYRDTWHLDVYADRRTAPRASRSSRWERRLLAHAAEAWFVNAPLLEWHADEHPAAARRMHVVANGYDPELVDRVAERPRGPLVLGYLGTMYGPMPVREALEGWRLARARSALAASGRFEVLGRLGHYSTPDVALLELIAEYRDDAVVYLGPVEKADVRTSYERFDALALILGRSRYVTSGKVFEYAATGLPIVGLHHPETASSSALEGRPMWHPAPAVAAEAFAEAIISALEDAASLDERTIAAASGWSERMSRERQLAPRIAALRATIGAHA